MGREAGVPIARESLALLRELDEVHGYKASIFGVLWFCAGTEMDASRHLVGVHLRPFLDFLGVSSRAAQRLRPPFNAAIRA